MMLLLKRSFYFLAISLLYVGCLQAGKDDMPSASTDQLAKFHKARIKTAKGDIVFKFNEQKAPQTCARLKALIKSGFYNGIVFHRVISGFVAQAGDPQGTGAGGSGQKLKAEFNDEKHIPGTVAMARKGNDVNSADSQFYISLGTHPHLDGSYTVFAKVETGLDIANKIAQGDKIINMSLE